MADIKISALPTSPAIVNGSVIPYTTGSQTRAAAVNTGNAANTIMIRDASGNVGVNTLNANTVGSAGTVLFGNASNLTNVPYTGGTNGLGTRYVSTTGPGGGVDGDIWYQI